MILYNTLQTDLRYKWMYPSSNSVALSAALSACDRYENGVRGVVRKKSYATELHEKLLAAGSVPKPDNDRS
jgi:hypothetical protein